MQRGRLLLGRCVSSWKPVRTASSRVARQAPHANKVALVTASTDGIGFAIARRLAQDGAHVVVSSRKQQNVDRAVATLQGEGLSVTGTVCHVGKAQDREQLVATHIESSPWKPAGGSLPCFSHLLGAINFVESLTQVISKPDNNPSKAVKLHGGIDILICNAGINPFFGNIIDATEEIWDKLLDTNVKATALLTKAVVPEMEKRGGGSVVIISSITAYIPIHGLGPYAVTKTALLGLTKNLAMDLAPRNIRVNCLAPGIIKTKLSRMLWADKANDESLKESLLIKRLGKPEDCAGIVSFLCSEDASYITAETVTASGGLLACL